MASTNRCVRHVRSMFIYVLYIHVDTTVERACSPCSVCLPSMSRQGACVHEGSPSIRHCLWYDNYTECLLFRNGVTQVWT